MTDRLRGNAAIVGVAEAGVGHVGGGVQPLDLMAEATRGALDDAGLRLSDVDALFTASSYYPMGALNVAEYLGIRPAYTDGTNVGGSSFIAHLGHAMAAVEAGRCEVALICYGSTQRSDGGLVTIAEPSPYERDFRPRLPLSAYALAAARHMHEYGTTREQLAGVAVAAREWARLNPAAYARDPLTVADVLESRMISSPLTLLDCCLVTDGAAAVVVTRADRAADSPKPGVFVLGAGEAHWHRTISQMPDLTVTAAADSGARAFAMAGLGPSDMDLLMLYDAFTVNTVLFLEDLGFCAKGEGGPFVESGAIRPGGTLPVNTNGGGLSYGHPGMYGMFLIVEAVRQLRGEAGARQVPGPQTALVHGNGGVLSHQATAVLGTAATL
ncbi:acetyl-CoA acetyltransferase [Nonomuraea terrae]|uniref:acetyl-CoA acetyltransferase n=1 Tax=Nonomuraea terrae TaxID=2530383 RepID=UPI0037A69CE9